MILNLAGSLIESPQNFQENTPNNLVEFYMISSELINSAAQNYGNLQPIFREVWEKNMPSKIRTRILLLTATDTEDDALNNALAKGNYRALGPLATENGYGHRFKKVETSEVIHVRSSAGSV